MRASVLVVALCALFLLGACARTPEEKAAAHQARAAQFLKQGRLDEAILEFRSALAAKPDDPEALVALGDAYLHKGEAREAYRAFTKAVELAPANADAQLRLGELYLLAGSASEARERAERALAADPDRAAAYALLGKTCAKEGNLEEALAAYDEAIARAPAAPEHRVAKATALYLGGRLEEARRVMDEALAQDPKETAYILLLAQVAETQGDRATVDALFVRLFEVAPDSPTVWLVYGQLWVTRGEGEKALQAFEKAGQADPKGTAGWEKTLDLALDRAELGRARKALGEIRARNPKSTAATYYEGRILLAERRLAEAVPKLQEFLREFPNHAEARYFLGLAQFGMGSVGLAKGDLQKAVELNTRFTKARLLLAECHLAGREFDLALRALEPVGREAPGDTEALLLRGSALLGLGRVREARSVLEALVAARPSHARGYQQLARVHLAEKEPTRAVTALARALDAQPADLGPLVLGAEILASEKKFREAVAWVEDHIRKRGDSAGARELLSQVLLAQGDRERAKREAELAIEMEPRATEAYLVLARLHEGPEAVREALTDVDRALEREPAFVRGWVIKGMLHGVLQEHAESQRAHRRALSLSPDLVASLNDLAYNLAEHGGDVNEALKFAERAVELAPRSALANDTLGWIYVKKGVYLKAVSHLEPASQILVNHPEVQYHLGMAYAGLGEKDKARASLQRALELSATFPGEEKARKTLEELGSK